MNTIEFGDCRETMRRGPLPVENFKLHQGDCLELMRDLPDASVDLILCDLPYGTTACKWDAVIPFDALWSHYKRIIKKDGAIILTASQPFTSALVMSNPSAFKHGWVWNKRFAGNFATAKFAPMKIHEDVLVFSFGRVPYKPIMTKRDTPIKLGGNKCQSDSAKIAKAKDEYIGKVYDEKYPESILFHPRERGLHPTQKPVGLMEYLVRTYTNEGELVLDNCMGSGTTGVACANSGRRFIGMERDAGYFEVASKRIAEAFALQHGRQYLGCELNPEYGPLQQERIAKATPEPIVQQSLFQPEAA